MLDRLKAVLRHGAVAYSEGVKITTSWWDAHFSFLAGMDPQAWRETASNGGGLALPWCEDLANEVRAFFRKAAHDEQVLKSTVGKAALGFKSFAADQAFKEVFASLELQRIPTALWREAAICGLRKIYKEEEGMIKPQRNPIAMPRECIDARMDCLFREFYLPSVLALSNVFLVLDRAIGICSNVWPNGGTYGGVHKPLEENLLRVLPSIQKFIKQWGCHNPFDGCALPSSMDFLSTKEEQGRSKRTKVA